MSTVIAPATVGPFKEVTASAGGGAVYARYVITSSGSMAAHPPSGAIAGSGEYNDAGALPTNGDYVLLTRQDTYPEDNRLWVYNSAGAWTAAPMFPAGGNAAGARIEIVDGLAYAGTNFRCTSGYTAAIIGTHPLTWKRIFGSLLVVPPPPVSAWTLYNASDDGDTATVQNRNGGVCLAVDTLNTGTPTNHIRPLVLTVPPILPAKCRIESVQVADWYGGGFAGRLCGFGVICFNASTHKMLRAAIGWNADNAPYTFFDYGWSDYHNASGTVNSHGLYCGVNPAIQAMRLTSAWGGAGYAEQVMGSTLDRWSVSPLSAYMTLNNAFWSAVYPDTFGIFLSNCQSTTLATTLVHLAVVDEGP